MAHQLEIIEVKLGHIVIVSQIMKYVGRLAYHYAQLSPTTSKGISSGELFMPILISLNLKPH